VNDANVSSDPELQKLIERFPRLLRGARAVVCSQKSAPVTLHSWTQ